MPARLNPVTGKGYSHIDRTGTRLGRLVFLECLGRDIHKHTIWKARCDCGVTVSRPYNGRVKSCGCLQREKAAEIQRAKSLSPEERIARARANAARQRARRRSDPLRAMQARLSRLHRHALAKVGAIKTSPTFEALGYSVMEFVEHIERQFLPGMSWENMRDWQIDHIIPVSEARTEADVVALNQLPNLRPMWAGENNAKKAKRTTLL